MNTLQHIAISASAGSGKTFQLTNRFIYLLHLTEKPERIIALTFTRTAAGEFFQNIIEKLCDAAEDSNAADALSKSLNIEADSNRYHELLRLLIRSMHRLNLQTLDSFFFRIVSAFSLELGLTGSLNLLDESSEPRVRNEVRDRIVHSPSELSNELNEFWHAFKQATYGKEERSVERIISEFIQKQYALFLDSPERELWGQTHTIWNGACPWQVDKAPDWDVLADQLRGAIPEGLGKAQQNDFESTAKAVENYGAKETLNTLLKNAFVEAANIFNGAATIKVRKALELPSATCAALADCLRAIAWHHLKRSLENTQGVHRILQAYHENYDRLVRRPGRLAFADLTNLLSPKNTDSPMGSVDPMMRELMDFRLDGQYDHWLFDEFQDTSRPQWSVVENLIDEIVQDPSGQRSFYYVGDTKQCLYLWRNSDDRLFHDIQKQYPNIERRPLSVSWRSAQPILDAVNDVFSDNAAIAEHFSADTAARWKRAWQTHAASEKTKALSGFACWLKAEKSDAPDRNQLILQILEDLKPLERGMTVGVLTRNNKNANAIADFLRENTSGMAVHTGSAVRPGTDNSAGTALLAMLRLAAHPGDAHARGMLQLIDCSSDGASLLQAVETLRHTLLTESSEHAVRQAAAAIIEHLDDDDARHRQRLDQLVNKARGFDKEEQRNIDGLHNYLKDSSSGEQPAQNTIIVETVHKSKGLEYDVVILINEDKTVRAEREISPLLNTEGEAEWIMEPVKKEIMEADPALSPFLEQSESQRGFGNLCTLYVAMTRAKRALYMISDFDRVSKGSTVNFLRDTLGDTATQTDLFQIQNSTLDVERSTFNYPMLWSTGDPKWFETYEAAETPAAQNQIEESTPPFKPAHPRLQLARPSTAKAFKREPAHAFRIDNTATKFGSQVHDAFEAIEWLNETQEAVSPLLEKCFESAEIRAAFTKPSTPCTVWRERAFSYVEGDQFHNGIFDRVVIHLDLAGAMTHAEIIDFKTDKIHKSNTIEQAIEHHRPQLEAYRTALSKILRIQPAQIDLKLLFTSEPSLVKL
ncbi:MAG: UvrD-helicase domain-containing protein [Opitutaceae bacterium]